MNHQAGECWTYRAPVGFENSRIVIGAVISFTGHEPVLGCCIEQAPVRQSDGSTKSGRIPFLPLTLSAFESSVVARDGTRDVPADFGAALENWQNDSRGLSYFTVPFEGYLERMIALQMAKIVGHDASAA